MDEIDKNLPDDFWRKAFEDAAETPPKRVWAAIEQHLDESSGPKVVPLWRTGLVSSRPFRWGTGLAASLALLLVGWWALNSNTADRQVAQKQTDSPSETVAEARKPRTTDVSRLPTNTRSAYNATDAIASAQQMAVASAPVKGPSIDQLTARQHVQTLTARAGNETLRQLTRPDANLSMAEKIVPTQPLTSFSTGYSDSGIATSFATNSRMLAVTSESPEQAEFNFLTGKPLRMRRPGAIQRIVWARPAEVALQPEEIKSKRQHRELWASVSMMPGSFNPAVSIRSAQPAFTNSVVALASPSGSASVQNRANFSVAYQAGAGVQLSERWSLESGIGYLSGRSTVEAPGSSYSASAQQDLIGNRNGTATNAYVDALRNSIQSQKAASGAQQASYNTVAIQASYDSKTIQAINNDYQFVQVPVQVGYQLRPRKKLSMAVLGGLLANVFVRNTVGNTLVVTSKDGVYRPVALAATMGARLRYRPTRQWSASVSGVYQPSLESGTQADAQVQSHPTSAGMSFGVDYHF